jgi:hypothetical protein
MCPRLSTKTFSIPTTVVISLHIIIIVVITEVRLPEGRPILLININHPLHIPLELLEQQERIDRLLQPQRLDQPLTLPLHDPIDRLQAVAVILKVLRVVQVNVRLVRALLLLIEVLLQSAAVVRHVVAAVRVLIGPMRLTHKKTVISHKLCTHF